MKITAKGVLFSRCVWDMNPNETAYTVPWAYNPITNDLNLSYDVSDKPKGTMAMKVKRTWDGYELEIPKGYTYSRNPVPAKFE